jgi:hypothetical protein
VQHANALREGVALTFASFVPNMHHFQGHHGPPTLSPRHPTPALGERRGLYESEEYALFLDLVAQKHDAVVEGRGLGQFQVSAILENAPSLAA